MLCRAELVRKWWRCKARGEGPTDCARARGGISKRLSAASAWPDGHHGRAASRGPRRPCRFSVADLSSAEGGGRLNGVVAAPRVGKSGVQPELSACSAFSPAVFAPKLEVGGLADGRFLMTAPGEQAQIVMPSCRV